MSSFTVQSLELRTAGMVLSSGGIEIANARSTLTCSGGALAGTTADAAFDALASAAVSVSASFAKAADALSMALSQAAGAYDIADQSAAASMLHKRG